MKKILLACLTAGIAFSASAQLRIENRLPEGFRATPLKQQKNVLVKKNADRIDNFSPLNSSQARVSAAAVPNKSQRVATTFMEEEAIGYTYYDLQSNNSMSRRLVKNANGSFSANWTFSPNTNTDYPQRGTGYNYYDPATPTPPNTSHWFFSPDGPGGDFPSQRVEGAYRTGFVNMVTTPSGREMTIGHSSNLNKMLVTSRPTIGSGAWTPQINSLGLAANNDTWAKTASSGDTVYVICHGTGVQDPPVPLYGQDGPILFSRSVDGGVTFPIQRQLIHEIDSSSYLGFSAETYNIDASGSTVAITYGGTGVECGLLKSTDGGMTWTKTIIVSMQIPFFNFDSMFTYLDADTIVDHILSGSGDGVVLIDHNGMAHVWTSLTEWWRDSATAAGSSWVNLAQDGMYYWNETMGVDSLALIAWAPDLNGDSAVGLVDSTCNPDYGRYGNSMTRHPSVGINAAGHFYLTYQTVNELTDSLAYHQFYTHAYMTTSVDGGTTWSYAFDLVLNQANGGDGELQECVYASMARVVDDFAYVVYQRDPIPGQSLSTETCDDQNNVTGLSDIIFVKVDALTVGLPKVNVSEALSVAQNYPNPARGITSIDININKRADIKIRVTDLVGREIYTTERTNAANGIHTIQLNTSNWNNGLYFYTVEALGQRITKQMIVQ